MDPEALMRLAIEKARQGIAAGQTPFGCALSLDGEVVAVEHNLVWATQDITAHAEIVALRTACHEVGDISLAGAVVATTCEPCPMCAAALHWARVAEVHFGASISDAEADGFGELVLPAAQVIAAGGNRLHLTDGVLQDDCIALFEEWEASPTARPY